MRQRITKEREAELIAQGRQQFMAMGFEDYQGRPRCPHKSDGTWLKDKTVSLWMKGYLEARFAWFKPLNDRKRFAKRVEGRVPSSGKLRAEGL